MDNEILLQEPWLRWAIEIQSLAQCGLTYTKDPYDAERYEQLRDISSEMLSYKTGIPTDKVKEIFCSESGYQTPKLDTRAALFQEGRILLVHENNGTWSLPGGWVDVLESVGSNTVKEVREESGLEVKPVKLIAVQDRNKHNTPPYAYGVCKVFVLCDTLGGRFTETSRPLKPVTSPWMISPFSPKRNAQGHKSGCASMHLKAPVGRLCLIDPGSLPPHPDQS